MRKLRPRESMRFSKHFGQLVHARSCVRCLQFSERCRLLNKQLWYLVMSLIWSYGKPPNLD